MMSTETTALLERIEALSLETQQLARASVLWMVVAALLLVFVLLLLVAVLGLRRRFRRMEIWLAQETAALRDGQKAIAKRIAAIRPPVRTPPQPSPADRKKAPTPPNEAPATYPLPSPMEFSGTVNEMLASSQPYNLAATLHAMEPELPLALLTPRAGAGFSREVLLQSGGDGLFAYVQGDEAYLYPNYNRFSATLDPKPLFDGARHDGRIHAVSLPALLARQADGLWKLVQKGRVDMRQG